MRREMAGESELSGSGRDVVNEVVIEFGGE